MKCLGLIQCAEEPQGLSWNHFFLAHLCGGNCAPVPKHRAGFTYRLYRLKSGVSRSKGSSRKLWYAHGRRKDFFHGGWKVVIFYFSRSKLRKQPLLLRISKSMMGTEPPPAPSRRPWVCIDLFAGIWSNRQIVVKILCLDYSWNLVSFT